MFEEFFGDISYGSGPSSFYSQVLYGVINQFPGAAICVGFGEAYLNLLNDLGNPKVDNAKTTVLNHRVY